MPYKLPDMPFDEPQRKIVDRCSGCGEPIYEGECYYDINGTYCEGCIEDFKKWAKE